MNADAPDAERSTLHIRCGSDIRETLRSAGFEGDFLEYSDPVCEGPVPQGPDLLAQRARYLAAAYGTLGDLTEATITARLRKAEDRLAQAHQHDRVVLWFEHDSHDQLVLARCLSRFAETRVPRCLELICVDHHPSVKRFHGLGQLTPAALAGLWPDRRTVSAEQIALGGAIWDALRAPDPNGLARIARTGTQALPLAANALWRHLQELPGLSDGLSLTQRLILQLLARSGPMPIAGLFAAMLDGHEPLVFMGDWGFLRTVDAMAATTPPVLTLGEGEGSFSRVATITGTGHGVLAGTLDYLALRPAERWVGGVRAGSGWRFDAAAKVVVGSSIVDGGAAAS